MKNEVIVIITTLLIVSIFGCTSSPQQNDSSIYGSTYVNFQMPNGWELHPMPGNGTVIWMKGDPRIRVTDLNQQQYNQKLRYYTVRKWL